jgi:hypothetical protein
MKNFFKIITTTSIEHLVSHEGPSGKEKKERESEREKYYRLPLSDELT